MSGTGDKPGNRMAEALAGKIGQQMQKTMGKQVGQQLTDGDTGGLSPDNSPKPPSGDNTAARGKSKASDKGMEL